MKIKTEAQLSTILASALQSSFQTNTFVREFKAGYGIADLVFAKNYSLDLNSLNRSPIDNYYALRAVFELKELSSFSVVDASLILNLGLGKTRNIINYLFHSGYLRKSGSKYSISIGELSNPIKNLVAIEVKLRDWKQGILQARRYKSYTNECYLAILSEYERNIDYSLLDKFDIGLILFSPDTGEISIKRKPVKDSVFPIYDELQEVFAKEYFLHRNFNTSKLSLSN